MSVFDPIAPYAAVVKACAWLALASVLLFGGCSWGKAIQSRADQKQITEMDGWLSAQREQAAILSATLSAIDSDAAKAKLAAGEQAKQAAKAVDRARANAREYQKQIATIEAELERAQGDPECVKQLRMPVCAVLY